MRRLRRPPEVKSQDGPGEDLPLLRQPNRNRVPDDRGRDDHLDLSQVLDDHFSTTSSKREMNELTGRQEEILRIAYILERFYREERRWPVIEEIREILEEAAWRGRWPEGKLLQRKGNVK